MSIEVHGLVEPGFSAVEDAFRANFAEEAEVGAAFALYHHGQLVVDIWSGVADIRAGRPWDRDTAAVVFSTTKGATAVCLHLLAERHQLDLDAPVVDLWPEFGAGGKQMTTTRMMLAHRTGLPILDPPMALADALGWDAPVAALAAQVPRWEPGTAHGYQAITYGWLLGEVVLRVTGRTLGTFFAEEVAGPLGLDFWIGLPAGEAGRVARLVAPRDPLPEDPTSLAYRALNPTSPPLNFNSDAVRAAELPGANGITTARSLAALYGALIGGVDGVGVLQEDTVADATREQSSGRDRVLEVSNRFGSGFALPSDHTPLMGPGSFGHGGAGGSMGMADPSRALAFGYVMNQMRDGISADPRVARLVAAVERSVA